MKQTNIQYGIINVPEGAVLCKIEQGGDKNGQALYRFVNSGSKTEKKHIAIVTHESLLPDLYGALWAKTKKGWIKVQNYITWYSSYNEAANAYASLTNRKRKIILTLLVMILTALFAYIIYKIGKNKLNNPIVDTTFNIDISNETTE